ncbi:MAG TPA: hypothetical protein VKQ36_13575, partial [Ktedonobacterales bacterium]|nr:hypothetical protein [Ktedonobacterales bacterium]
YLRTHVGPCEPPVGVGAFDILYASAREVVVWYSPSREGQQAREVAIPCEPLRAAWEALLTGEPLSEGILCELAGGVAGGRWLLVTLAQLPHVQTLADADGALSLVRNLTPPPPLPLGEGVALLPRSEA